VTGDPLDFIKFWCWSDYGCRSAITFPLR